MEREANTATDTPAIDAGIPPEPAAQAFSSTDTPLAVIAPPATEPESIAASPIPVAEMSSAMTNEAGPVAESVDVTMDEAPAIAAETADPHVEAPQTAQEPTSPVLPLEPMPTTTATAVTANEPANEEPAEPPSVNAPQETLVSVGPATEAAAMQRVESFLDQLKGALIEMAQRPAALATSPAPPSPSLDIAPLVAALQAGFDRSAQMSEASSSALSVLAEKVASFGEHVEQGVQRVVADLRREPQPVERQATEFVITRSDRTPIVLFAVAALVIAWSGIFWFKTGSTRLAFSTLVGANVVGCCLLAAWRRRV